MNNNMSPMLSCHEARKILYDVETMRSVPTEIKRPSVLALAKAHLLVCVKCNSYFESEKAFIAILHDKVTAFASPIPTDILGSTLHLVQDARLAELEAGRSRPGIIARIRRFFS